jgi:pilus assembly protein CpaF
VENLATSKFLDNNLGFMSSQVTSLSRLIRNRALDGAALDESILGVLDEHIESSTKSTANENQLLQEVRQSIIGFSFLQPFLDDETIEEIWINQPGEIWFAKNGTHHREEIVFSAEDLQTQLERMIRVSGRRLDRTSPFIDAQLSDGYRLHAVIPDITRNHLSLNIRKFTRRILRMADLQAANVLNVGQSNYLLERFRNGANIMISGATQAGKTTLLSALLSELATSERVVSVEDTFELRCLVPDWVAMQTRPPSTDGKFEIDLRRLVRESLRMRPNRLVVGEVRGAEALDMLIAMNSGIPSLCTIHANSADEALTKLKTLPLLAGGNISSDFLTTIIRGSLDLFVHCSRDQNGIRKITSIKQLSSGHELNLEEVPL